MHARAAHALKRIFFTSNIALIAETPGERHMEANENVNVWITFAAGPAGFYAICRRGLPVSTAGGDAAIRTFET